MTLKTKFLFITATALILIGLIIFGGVMTVLKWDFKKLSTAKYETNGYEIKEAFTDVSVISKTAHVSFSLTDKETPYVVCYEQKKLKHAVSVNDETLTVEVKDTRKWYDHIEINFESPKVTVFLPAGSYGACTVKTSTGDTELAKGLTFKSIEILGSTGSVTCFSDATESIKIKIGTGDIKAESITSGIMGLSVTTGDIAVSGVKCIDELGISVGTGKTQLSDVTCKTLTSTGSTGSISLKNVITAEKLDIKRSTGDVNLYGCDAGEIFITTDTGDVKGTLLSDKIFIANTNTGKKDVPKTVTGGRCEINTGTGDIILSVITP